MTTRLFSLTSLVIALISSLWLHDSQAYAEELSPIVVTATRTPVPAEDTLSDFVIITHEEIERAGHSSLTELLQAQRGVQIDSYGGSGNLSSVHMRGSSNAQVLMLLDGVRIESSAAGGPILNLIPLALIDHIEIVFGSQSTLYGANALGGVIQIFTKQGTGLTQWGVSSGYGSFGSSQESADIAGGFDHESPVRYALAVTHERSTGYNTIASNNGSLPFGYPQVATGFDREAIHAGLSYEWYRHQELGLRLFSTRNVYGYPGSDEADSFFPFPSVVAASGRVNQSVNRLTAFTLFSKNQITEIWDSALQFNRVFNFNQRLSPPAGFSPGSNDAIDMPETDVSWQNTLKLESGTLQVILESRVQAISTLYTFDQSGCGVSSPCSIYRSRTTNSIATAYSVERGHHLLTVSAREDSITGFDTRTNGGVGYGYKFLPDWRASIDISSGYRVPTYVDLFYPGSSNPSLVPESSRNAEVGFTFNHNEVNSRLFIFQNLVRNFIEPSSNSLVNAQSNPINLGSVRLKGASSALAYKFEKVVVSIGLDYLQATDENTGLMLPRVAKFASNWKVDYHDRGWNLGALITSSGSSYDDIKNTPTTINTPFVLFNLYGSYNLNRNWTVFARLNNVLNTQYQTAYGYAMPGFNGFGGLRYAFE